ncbi:DUF4232 domain-containing protein [Streptomyces pratensis]|nr:DUF4232 domain-containing protein [Streptomyces pratensis]
MAEGEVLINLKNTGSSSCSMHGFPGLDLESEQGTVSAGRSSGRTIPTVALAPGRAPTSPCTSRRTPGRLGCHLHLGDGDTAGRDPRARVPLAVGIPADTGSGSRITVDPVGSGK